MTIPRIPIVFIHGCGGSPESTFARDKWLAPLEAAGRRVMFATLPGHSAGDSVDPADYSNLADQLLERLPDHFDAVGFSLGGKLLLDIAVRAPSRVGRLVIGGVGDNVFAPERAGPLSAAALKDGIDDSTPTPIVQFYQSCVASGVPLRSVAAVLLRSPNPVFDERGLSGISRPMIVVAGDQDPIASKSDRLSSLLKSAAFIKLSDVDHFGLPTAPGFQQHALAFLSASIAPAS